MAQGLKAAGLSPEEAALVTDHEAAPTDVTRSALVAASGARFESCQAFEQAQDFDAAVRDCRAAVQLGQASGDPDVAIPLGPLASVLQSAGRYGEAAQVYRRLLALGEAVHGRDHPIVGLSLFNLAHNLRYRGQLDEAEALMRRSLALAERNLDPNDAQFAERLGSLAALLDERGRHDEAEALHRRALVVIAKSAPAPDNRAASNLLNGLAINRVSSGEFVEAETLFRRALEIRESHLGPNHPDVLTAVNNLAKAFALQGKHTEAESLYRRALVGREAVLGRDHPDVASSLNHLAGLLQMSGRYDEAEPLYRRALAIREAFLGPDHYKVAISCNDLAMLLRKLGRYGESELLFRRAHGIVQATLGPDHSEAGVLASNWGALLQAMGRFDEAELVLAGAVTTLEGLGHGHPSLATSLNNLASVLRMTGRYAEAEALFRRALAIGEATLGPGHPAVATRLSNLALLLTTLGRFDEAEPLHRRSLAIREAALGTGHPAVGTSSSNLAALLEATGRRDQAEPLYRRQLAINEATFGLQHPEVAASLLRVAGHLRDVRRYDEAELLARRSLAILQSTLSADHPDLSWALKLIGWLRLVRGHPEEARPLYARAMQVEEAHLARTLYAGTREQRRLRFRMFGGSTAEVLTLHQRHLPTSSEAAALALETLIRRKGRLLDLDRDVLHRIRASADADGRALLEQYERLTARLGVLENRVPSGGEEWAQRQARRDAVVEEAAEVERRLAVHSAAFRQSTQPVTVEEVAAQIPEGAALLEIAVYRPAAATEFEPVRYVAYVLRGDGRIVSADLGPASVIEPQVRALRGALVVPSAAFARNARAVFERTVGPLWDELREVTHLFVAADGLLNLVPFEVLLDAGPPGAERIEVSYLTSGRDLVRRAVPDARATDPVVIFDVDYGVGNASATHWTALPGAAAEGRVVQRVLKRSRALTGGRATERALRSLQRPRVLHVASHGYFEGGQSSDGFAGQRSTALRVDPAPLRQPLDGGAMLRSGVVLAGANAGPTGDDDGLLTAAELANLDLGATTLVMLSACETGTGEVRNGDGVHGLRRGLVLAGAQAQVLSLWKVDDDATAALTKAFYRQLRRGRTVGDGLRRAKAKLRDDPRWAHPYFWAAFTVSGDADATL